MPFLLRKKFPFFQKIHYRVLGQNNSVVSPRQLASTHPRSKILCCGNNNTIEFGKNVRGKLSIFLWGDNNRVKIGDNVFIDGKRFEIHLGIGKEGPVNNSRIEIGESSAFASPLLMRTCEHNSVILIGNDCMFSSGIDVWCSDTHAIIDESGVLKNKGREIIIGNHVWIGKDVKIGKNVSIGSGSIVGWGSVVVRGTYEENSLVAGNPATTKKRAIRWDRRRPNCFL